MAEFTIDTLNEILFAHTIDDESKIKLLKAELELTYDMFMDEMIKLLEELEETGYNSEQFRKLSNIKNNSLQILEQREGMEG